MKALITTLMLCWAAASAVAETRLQPIAPADEFFKSLGVKDGIYYVMSPLNVRRFKKDNGKTYYTSVTLNQSIVKDGYVAIYADGEDISQRIQLAKENIEVIENELDTAITNRRTPISISGPGPTEIASDEQSVALACHLKFTSSLHNYVETTVHVRNVSMIRFCGGFGLFAGLAGYKLIAGERGLDLMQVVAVAQPIE